MIKFIEWFHSTKKPYLKLCAVHMEFLYHDFISVMHVHLHILVEGMPYKNFCNFCNPQNVDLITGRLFNANLYMKLNCLHLYGIYLHLITISCICLSYFCHSFYWEHCKYIYIFHIIGLKQ